MNIKMCFLWEKNYKILLTTTTLLYAERTKISDYDLPLVVFFASSQHQQKA